MKCMNCGHDSEASTGRPFKNSMYEYMNGEGKKTVFNENADSFKDGKGVTWTRSDKVKAAPAPVKAPQAPAPATK